MQSPHNIVGGGLYPQRLECYSDGVPATMNFMIDYDNHYRSKDSASAIEDSGILLGVGNGGPHSSVVVESPSAPCVLPEVALTTGLVTLSVHEALTFDGVELALHPDVFHSSNHLSVSAKNALQSMNGKNNSGGGGGGSDCIAGGDDGPLTGGSDGKCRRQLRPGDLVEIRVWDARPGVSPRLSTSQPKPNSSSSAILNSNAKALGGISLHSRNSSLAAAPPTSTAAMTMGVLSPMFSSGVGSVRSNTYSYPSQSSMSGSFASSNVSSLSQNLMVSSRRRLPPPLPSIVGGDGSFRAGRLHEERLLGSPEEAAKMNKTRRNSGLLRGERLPADPAAKEASGAATYASHGDSALLAGTSSLFRLLNHSARIPNTSSARSGAAQPSPGRTDGLSTESAQIQGRTNDGLLPLSHSRVASSKPNITRSGDSTTAGASRANTPNSSASRDEMKKNSSPSTNNNPTFILPTKNGSNGGTTSAPRHRPIDSHAPLIRTDSPIATTAAAAHVPLPPSRPLALISPSITYAAVNSGTLTPSSDLSSPNVAGLAPISTPPTSSAMTNADAMYKIRSTPSLLRPPSAHPIPLNPLLQEQGRDESNIIASVKVADKSPVRSVGNSNKIGSVKKDHSRQPSSTLSKNTVSEQGTTMDGRHVLPASDISAASQISGVDEGSYSPFARNHSIPFAAVGTATATVIGGAVATSGYRRLCGKAPPPAVPGAGPVSSLLSKVTKSKGDIHENDVNLATVANMTDTITSSAAGDRNATNVSANNADHDAFEDVLETLQHTHVVRISFVMPVSEKSLSSIKSGARTQVSLLRRVAELYRITAYDTVTVTQIAKSKEPYVLRSIAADFVTVTMKDQFVSRGDMYNFQKSFLNCWVYEGKRLSFDGIRTNAKVIRHGDHAIRSGIISEDTKMTFRSRSARIIWLVQLSSEMWDFASPYEATNNQKNHESSCHIYFDKFVTFVRRLFDKWKKLELTHNLTVVFFSRTYIRQQGGEKEEFSTSGATSNHSPSVHVDADGRLFEDHYKIVIENETKTDWESLIYRMKHDFVKYPKMVGWDLTFGNERIPSTATQGNVLEAINITLNLLHLHYIDRDLHRTGNSIVIITPGNGVFEIEKNLAGITKQRMMDNGIGSDMLSLGLPPLHVAPFFLYKEKSSSSAEEIQGFDDWKTYFEVPHWMNLSFVRYDNDEEPMLYKDQHPHSEYTDAAENTSSPRTWQVSNGFLKRNSPVTFSSPKIQMTPSKAKKSEHRRLISEREFQDILQACRPRSRGEYGSGLPSSLCSLLYKFVSEDIKTTRDNVDRGLHYNPRKTFSRHEDPLQGAHHEEAEKLSPHRVMHHSRARYLEWGAVNFDDFVSRRLNPSQGVSFYHGDYSGSQSSPSSSFASAGSCMISSNQFNFPQLHTSTFVDAGAQSLLSGGGDTHMAIQKVHHSDDSMTTLSTDGKTEVKHRKLGHNEATLTVSEHLLGGSNSRRKSIQPSTSIVKLMLEHDKHAFSRSSIVNLANNIDSKTTLNAGKASPENGFMNNLSGSFCPGSPRLDEMGILRSHSSFIPLRSNGGIEAALAQYDITKQGKENSAVGFPPVSRVQGISENFIILPEEPIGRSLAVSPLSIGVPLSLDRRNDGIRPSAMRLVVAEGIPRATHAFQPTDLQRRDSRQNKPLSQVPKDSWASDRRNSISGILQHQHGDSSSPIKKQHFHRKSSQQRSRNKKNHGRHGRPHSHHHHHHHSTHHHRRKPWVLNPFRQQDEDEVLSKRTHNRRRWSHVFPLGEIEFKRHAGPNWKSLCQPAILPITIDFHPSPQELEDQDKFRIKQYSVTLPPMNEANYKSHTELLNELVLQRIIQDFQIVPRSIIQQSARRGDAADNHLEHTLSMGHKIQRLSYNHSSDSVDVVQYHANFAENENPQTYRYMLWSALRQDFVSVVQTFTKYTSPYKWNELDMLISGDTITTILEGMRYPRISFVIIPDPFLNQTEEKEFCNKFQRLVDYFSKLQPKSGSNKTEIQMSKSSDTQPLDSTEDKRFIVDLRKRSNEKYEWMELVHDSNCDTRRTFRMTMRWLVAVASKIDQQSQLLHRRCAQYGLKLVSVPHFSGLRTVFLNPFAVPITIPVKNKACVDSIEGALTKDFNFVYDGNHMSDPNEIDCLGGFDFVVNKWSIKKRKKFVPARQYLHRTGTLFARILRDSRGCAIFIIYLNQKHIAGDELLLHSARFVFNGIEQHIAQEREKFGC